MKSSKLLMFIAFFVCAFIVNAQIDSGKLNKDENSSSQKLSEKFDKFEIFEFEGKSFNNNFRSAKDQRTGIFETTLQFGKYSVDIELEEVNILGENYVLSVFDGEQVHRTYTKPEVRTYRGYVKGTVNLVSMTVDDGFLYGFFEDNSTTYYFEPAFYYDSALKTDLFVIYDVKDAKEHPEIKCAAEFGEGHHHHGHDHNNDNYEDGNRNRPCQEVEYNIACDYSMRVKYGSVQGVQNRNIGVVNNIQTNYIDVFAVDYIFVIPEQYIVNCSGCDPWTSSTNPNTLLDDFTSWAPSGFSERHDVATLWSNRSFNGSTIGLAWLDAVCRSTRYNICQDFSSNAQYIRVLTAHELGHNFGTGHDPSGSNTIMAPTVNTATTWSSSSVNQVNSYMALPFVNCTAACAPSAPPVASFTANITEGCVPLIVQFTDNSTNNPDQWYWEFPGGTPSTSTQQNPVVTYNDRGIYDVTLVASNATGSGQITRYDYINALSFGPLDIDYDIDFNILTVINNSDPSYSYSWDFGDGYSSTDFAPTHEYVYSGNYTITLYVEGECGSDFITYDILAIVPIIADFEVGNLEVCVGEYVPFYNNTSGDATDFHWEFEGGTPATSNQFSPVVVYNTIGVYDVSLTAFNQYTSDSKSVQDYVTVVPNTVADFDYVINGDQVQFINNSVGGNDYFWDFGDGTNSSDFAPVKTYAGSGNYTVTLHVYGYCGNDIYEVNIVISLDVTAGISYDVINDCVTGMVQFYNQSSGDVQNVLWVFEGGTPATSTEMNPIVAYHQGGSFDVSLTVSNSGSQDILVMNDVIIIGELPAPSFEIDYNNGNLISIINNSSNFNLVEYNMGDGTILNTTHVFDYQYQEPGHYQITITLENHCGTIVTTYDIIIAEELTAYFNFSQNSECAPVTVTYTNLSTGNVISYNWSFPGGTPATSTLPNPTVQYSSPGLYSATLVVSDGVDQSSYTVNNAIAVNTGPLLNIYFEQSDKTVALTNNSSNFDHITYDFGNGHQVTDVNFVEYTYPEYGNYIITVTVSNECGTESQQFIVIDNTPPVADFTASSTEGCVPLTVQFQNMSSQHALSFVWTFEGGTPVFSTEANPTVTYSTPGIFDVQLVAIGYEHNDTLLLTDYITVGQLPAAGFTFIKSGLQVTFSNQSANGNSYIWNFGDGNISNIVNPVHQYEEEGIYSVRLIVTNDCGSDTITRTVNLLNTPVSGFSTVGSTSGCLPLQVQFSDQSEGEIDSYLWIFEGGTPATSTLQNPVVTYNTHGQFDVTLITTNQIGSDTLIMSDYINIYDEPSEVDINVQKTGLNVNFTAVPGFANYLYTWDFGDGATGTGASVFHSYDFEGEYIVTLLIQNACGEYVQEFTVNITSLIPVGNFSIGSASGCVPLVVTFSDETINNPTSWLWSFPGGTPSESTEQEPTVTYNQSGNYSVTLTVTNEHGSHTRIRNNFINVGNMPKADFMYDQAGNDITFSNTSIHAYWYQWNFGDGNSSTDIHPQHTYEDGEYLVTLISTNGCGSDTTTQTINILTSTYNVAKNVSLTLYPNPTNGDFYIEINDSQKSLQEVELLDLFGRSLGKVEMGKDHYSAYKYRITPMSAPIGTTIVKIRLTDGSFVFRKLIFIE